MGIFVYGKIIAMLEKFISLFNLDSLWLVLNYVYLFLPVWMPLLLLVVFFEIWVKYIQTKFINKEGSVLLEIKLPREITKSPAAMEVVLTSLFQEGKNNFLDAYVTGKVRPWFSLELVSVDGQVKFFIWTRPKIRRIIETQIYAQYPGVEIHEAEDYTKNFQYPEKVEKSLPPPLWGAHFKLSKDDVYPIKTYVDYGLEKDPKEEFKIDPMTAVLEFLGSMKRGEQVWIQILIQAHRKEGITDSRIYKKPDWTSGGKEVVKELLEKLKSETEDGGSRYRQPTEGEKDIISALERSMTKFPFEVCMRALYIAEPASFNPIGISGLIGSVRQYGSPHLNSFKLSKPTSYDYPWQDFRGKKSIQMQQKILDAYRHRSFFHTPYKHYGCDPYILNTEELATIFHFPGSVASTPTIQKTMSKKGEAPPNLPI
jgi:hypothetical protein